MHAVVWTLMRSPLPVMLMAYLHFVCLKSTARSFLITIPFVIVCLIIPLLRDQTKNAADPVCMATYISFILRSLDASSLDAKTIRNLKFIDYLRFLISFQLPESAGQEQKDAKMMEKLSVSHDQQTWGYFAGVLPICFAKFILSLAILKYLKVFRSEWHRNHMEMCNFNDFMSCVDIYLLGIGLLMTMDVSITMVNHFFSLVLQTPYVPMMNQPYLATSIRDFWANRWNLIVQRGLRKLAFQPVLYLLGHRFPLGRVPKLHLAIASLATFLLSAIIHEWIILVLLDNPTTWEQFAFFMLHGIITIFEVTFQSFLKGIIDFNHIPRPIKVLYTQFVLLLTGALFMNPFIREQSYFKIPIL